MTIRLEISIARFTGYPLHCQTDQPLYRPDPPPTYDVCPHCKRLAVPYWNHCDSHTFATHSCPHHGAVIPMKSAVMNDYPIPDWSAA